MSENEPTNKIEPTGDDANSKPAEDKKDLSEFDKLKASNDEFEKQLIRGRELKAESQKLEAEKMMAGTAGGHVEPVVKDESAKEYKDRVMAGNL